MTGDTEKGRSMRVSRTLLPLNSYLAIAQAAITPKTRLMQTEIKAVSKVSLIAESVAVSMSANTYSPHPLEKACAKTVIRGMPISIAMTRKARVIKTSLTGSGSLFMDQP